MQNQEEYRIIIFISHRSISFEYFQRDGAGKVVPLPYGSCQWPEPMAFYSSTMETKIGREASSAYHSGTPNAFFGYFEHLRKNLHYTRGGVQKQFGKILLDAAEEVFVSFFREQLLNNRGDLSANRHSMPVMIVCEEDVNDNEMAHLVKLFRDAGYGKAKVVSYKQFVERYARETLARDYACDYALEVWTEGADLTMALIDLRNHTDSPTVLLEGLGRDPRLDFIKDKIWSDMLGFNGFLIRANEEDAIERAALEFLNGTDAFFDGRIIASDGSGYNYWLNRHEFNFVQTEESAQIRREVSNFLTRNGLNDRSRILLVLRGSTANNTYFENNLVNGFDQILRSSKTIREQVKDLIVAEPIPSVQTAEEQTEIPARAPRQDPPAKPKPPRPPRNEDKKGEQPSSASTETASDADGKTIQGTAAEALDSLTSFIGRVRRKGTAELKDTVRSKYDSIKRTIQEKVNSGDDNTSKSDPVSGPVSGTTSGLRSWKREWRNLRAEAKGKINTGKRVEGVAMLRDFLREAETEGCPQEIISEINTELKTHDIEKLGGHVSPAVGATTPKSGYNTGGSRNGVSGMPPIPNPGQPGSPRPAGGGTGTPPPIPPTAPKSQGETFLKEGKLKEARDWYREQGDSERANKISHLLRERRSVEARKKTLEEYQSTRNREQAKKIVAELEEYLKKCSEVGYTPPDIRKLRDDYKKIK